MSSNLMKIFLHSFPMPIGFHRSGYSIPIPLLSLSCESKKANAAIYRILTQAHRGRSQLVQTQMHSAEINNNAKIRLAPGTKTIVLPPTAVPYCTTNLINRHQFALQVLARNTQHSNTALYDC
jgi:hypothetical protein